jgi:hypothetical protein
MNYNFHLKKIGQIKDIILKRFIDDIPTFKFNNETSFMAPNHITIYDYPDNKINNNIIITINQLSTILNPNDYHSASIDCILPNSYIKEHVDQDVYGANQPIALDLHKIHIPIITNPYTKQIWVQYINNRLDPKIEFLEQGGVYAYNNMARHCAINLGDTPRYHLILRYKNLQEYEWMKNG